MVREKDSKFDVEAIIANDSIWEPRVLKTFFFLPSDSKIGENGETRRMSHNPDIQEGKLVDCIGA